MDSNKAAKFEGVTDWRSIYIISLFSTIDGFQFNFFAYNFWPFATQLDPSISPAFIGIIMACSGIGEAISAPLFGIWTNKIGKINPPLIVSLFISMSANLIYFFMNSIANSYVLLFSRFLSGVGSGNRGVYLAYTAAMSTKSDRTKAMALSSGGALVGIMLGPSVQILFTWLGSQGVEFGIIRLSMYTCPALLAFVINILCVLLLVFLLDDRLDNRGTEQDTVSRANVTEEEDEPKGFTIRPDLIAVVVCMTTRAMRMLVTSNVDSIGSPYASIMFGFNEKEVLDYSSISQAGIGMLTTIMLAIQAFTNYTKYVSERVNCVLGMAALLFFHLITYPWPFLNNVPNCENSKFAWCNSDLRAPNVIFYYISYTLVFGIALPCLNNSLQSIYSLVLGNTRQGTMQGINQACGSLSRIFGPILMSFSFEKTGPFGNWTLEICFISLFLLIWAATYKRLVPAKEPEFDDDKFTPTNSTSSFEKEVSTETESIDEK